MNDLAIQSGFADVVRQRRSIRAFLPQPVPQALIEQVFELAQMAPSNCNSQPWVVHVASGATLERLRRELVAAASEGRPQPDVPLTNTYPDQYKTRRIGAAVALFEATGVGRDDMEARKRSFLRNFELFDAPHAAFIFMPRFFGLREAADCGMFAQTLMLALTEHGLGSCAQGALSHYMPTVREILGVGDELMCLFGLSFGYPDYADASDAARTVRAPLSETIHFHD